MSNRPAIRFKGHVADWVQHELSDLATFNPKAQLPDQFEYVDLESVVGTEMLSHRTESKQTAPSRAQRLAQTGDLFYQMVRPYQKNNYLFEKTDSNYVFSTGYAQMRPVIDGYFLLSLVQEERFVKVVLDNCTGTSYPAINSNDLAKIEVRFPDGIEQRKIGETFRQIDRLITLHQRKYDKLLTYKKAMLEKMFPKDGADAPEVRFVGFTGVWKRHKLSEILIQRIEHQTITSDAPLLAFSYAEGVINPEDKKTNKRDFIMTDKFSKIFSRTELNDIIYNPANVIHGAIHRNKLGTGVVSPIYKIFICNGVSPKYMGERLHTDKFIREISKYIEGTVVKLRTLSPEMFLDMVVEVPQSYTEQEKIGEFFEQLNVLIADQERKVSKIKDLKAALLNKMFI